MSLNAPPARPPRASDAGSTHSDPYDEELYGPPIPHDSSIVSDVPGTVPVPPPTPAEPAGSTLQDAFDSIGSTLGFLTGFSAYESE